MKGKNNMSTLKEITDSTVTIYLKPKEGLLLSVLRDLITFAFLALCIYVSQGSTWWTLLTGILFLMFLSAKLVGGLQKNTTTFKNTESAKAYLDKLAAENQMPK